MEEEIKTGNLYNQWTALDDRALAKDPISVRLPVHLLARLNSLCDVFPNRNRTDFIIDLLKAALYKLEVDGLTTEMPEGFEEIASPGAVPSIEYLVGVKYRECANTHYHKLAKKAGHKIVPDLFPVRESKNGK
jgi:hypothetical protein